MHKWYVGRECFKRGLYWRGLIHDYSKFYPDEWIPYANFFGVTESERTSVRKEAFIQAWMRHLHRNDHHMQYWVSISDQSVVRLKEMPSVAREEMIADWRGVSLTLSGSRDCRGWYLERQGRIPLAPKTKRWVEKELGI